jgi:hypothetical protein
VGRYSSWKVGRLVVKGQMLGTWGHIACASIPHIIGSPQSLDRLEKFLRIVAANHLTG